MTEWQLKELYSEEMSASAPDMEALWEKIDERVGKSEKKTEYVQPERKSKINLWRTGAIMAACAALAIVIPNAVRNNDNLESSAGIAADNAAAVYDDAVYEEEEYSDSADEEIVEEAVPEAEITFTTAVRDGLSYEMLSFPVSFEKGVEFSGESTDGYFVEDDILMETECFIDAVVDNVYASPDGDCVYYELTAKAFYGEGSIGEYVTVASRTPHEMYIGREYVIPVKTTEKGLQTVYDSVPQIELTADGGMVYYNGWESLDSGYSQSIIYPQKKVDDFFYDRMMFSSSGDITALIEKWKDIHREE